ncbi:MAG: hypothetical protein J6Q96_01360 [Bacteroidales bacterium]|nr:hypothetical protein [Bacteroidales bacterium]
MSSRRASFTSVINDVELEVDATVYDGEIDEFTVYVGDTIVTEVLSDTVIEKLQQEALYEVSDINIELTKADDAWKERE